MYEVTVDGEQKVWYSLEYALLDALGRGLGKEWSLNAVTPKGQGL